MSLALVSALASALCYGIASVLQSIGARKTEASATVDPRLMIRLAQSLPYVIGVGFDALGFLVSLVALRSLPLFVVQAIVSSYLAVVAVLAVVFLKARLGRTEWLAIVVVVAGLLLLAVSAGPEGPATLATPGRWALLGFGFLLALAAWAFGSVSGRAGALLIGALAGLGFGLVGVATRVLPDPMTVTSLLTDPAAYAVALGGLLGMLLFATALQRGAVTTATAATVAGQTFAPALVGVLVLGDHTRPGLGIVGLLGFVLAVAGAITLGKYGEL